MSQAIQLSLDDWGRILIPDALRNRLGLKPGMTLVVEDAKQGGVQLRVQEESSALIEKDGLLVFAGELIGDVTNVVREERERRTQELIRRSGL
ncbi:MAG: AbrB/MazE/SpoVT family DNA-binding domain-containing protein [Chloroflexi bacterium]|nr:AbrB/MazE/SpoVT family DNA-binding domain-containing protein [Chloroflexota bacterium]